MDDGTAEPDGRRRRGALGRSGRASGLDPWSATGLGHALTWHWNLLNRYPVLDVPLGMVENRMPAGMQVIGQTFTDLDSFQFGANWARIRQPLFAEGRFPSFT